MARVIQRFTALGLTIALSIVLVSCGGGGGGSSNSSNEAVGSGTVGILLTDKPADPDMFDSINAFIEKVELLGSEDNGRVVLYSGPVKEFDLLRLRNESIPLTFKDGVPAGVYCKIRLTLRDLELVLSDDTPDDSSDNETYHPKLPGNGKLDLLARGCFTVLADRVLTLQVDIDAGNSFHIVGNSNGFNFRPVVFVDVIDEEFDSKLVRLEGEITKIDSVKQTLLLCDAIPTENMKNLGCVTVHFGDESAYFNNQKVGGYGGMPRPIAELLAPDKLGLRLTVVGWPRFDKSSHDHDESDYEHYPLMQLDALVAELGEFLQVEGKVAVDGDQDGFAMSVSAGGPVISGDNLAVMLQPGCMDSTCGEKFNGTRIVSKSGELLMPDDIDVPLPVQVDGTLQVISGSDPILQAALVIVDRAAANAEQVTGVIVAVGTDSLTVDPDAATVCGIATDSLLVDLTDGTEFLTVTITNSGSLIAPGGNPAIGQTVGMNGSCKPVGYTTDNVVIVDDQRI
ncbi:MAG: DUF4382 domain-containing protein [Gammaproteobacteria bacterium]|nr:MAG: DUF4382 domain-containing protein [Gammaproteobacteria bacterium]UCH39939.1 MAG: DUF4382 domain-containing protein [Gammaproteobacteria bacterium]